MADFDPRLLNFLPPKVAEEIWKDSEVAQLPKGTELLRAEQYVKVLPIVLEGLVKVISRFDDRDLLLYYIEPNQSCIMTFYAALNNTQSKVFASVEEDATLLLIPTRLLPSWLREHPALNELFYHQFNLRYTDLLDTISHLLVDTMDKRLYEYLEKKLALTSQERVKMSHHQIAQELGTAREVVSRVLKKLEINGKIHQNVDGIKILT